MLENEDEQGLGGTLSGETPYEKPSVRRIELRVDETLTNNCKTGSGPSDPCLTTKQYTLGS